jgi:hypothetical protein
MSQIEECRFPIDIGNDINDITTLADLAPQGADNRRQCLGKPQNGRFVIAFRILHDTQFMPTELITTGQCRIQGMLREYQMIGPDIFHSHVKQRATFGRCQSLRGMKGGQGLIGFVAGSKGTSKGNLRILTVGVQSCGPKKVLLGNVVALTTVVVAPNSEPTFGSLRTGLDPFVCECKEEAFVVECQQGSSMTKGCTWCEGIDANQFLTALKGRLKIVATVGTNCSQRQYFWTL